MENAPADHTTKKRKPPVLLPLRRLEELLIPDNVERARAARIGATLSSILSREPGTTVIKAWKQSILQTMRECDPVTGYPCPKMSAEDEAATRAAMEAAKLPFKMREDPWTPPHKRRDAHAQVWKFRYPDCVAADAPPCPSSPIF